MGIACCRLQHASRFTIYQVFQIHSRPSGGVALVRSVQEAAYCPRLRVHCPRLRSWPHPPLCTSFTSAEAPLICFSASYTVILITPNFQSRAQTPADSRFCSFSSLRRVSCGHDVVITASLQHYSSLGCFIGLCWLIYFHQIVSPELFVSTSDDAHATNVLPR